MKKVLLIAAMWPCIVSAQLSKIDIETEHINVDIQKDDPASINSFLGLGENFSFIIDHDKTAQEGEREHIYYRQYYNNIPVDYSLFRLHYKNNEIYYIDGWYVDNQVLESTPQISEAQAFELAQEYVGATAYIWHDPEALIRIGLKDKNSLLYPQPHGLLTYFPLAGGENKRTALVYKFDIYAIEPLSRHYVYVDAITGEILAAKNQIKDGTFETRYSGTRYPCTRSGPYRLEAHTGGCGIGGDLEVVTPSKHPFTDNDDNWTAAEYDNAQKENAALDVHWGMLETLHYFWNHHGYRGYDGTGGDIFCEANATGSNAIKAKYTGTGDFIFGIGGSAGFSTVGPYASLDIVAHEFGHAVSANTVDLDYEGESGALDEGLSDIWAMCVEYYVDPSKATWRMGEDINPPFGLRNVIDPNYSESGPQPAYYKQPGYWYNLDGCSPNGMNDNCGIHTNMSVLSRWFYYLVNGGNGVTGIGIADAAEIVFHTEKHFLGKTSIYADMVIKSIIAAQDIYGKCSPQVEAVYRAWHVVGLGWAGHHYVNTTFLPSQSSIQRYYNIVANNLLMPSSNIMYKASESVKLEPGFESTYGSDFIAYIDNCPALGLKPTTDASDPAQDNPRGKMIGNISEKNVPGFTTYPNPASNILFAKGTDANASFTIADITGRISLHGMLQNGSIDISSLAQGNYIITISSKDGIKHHSKFIKK